VLREAVYRWLVEGPHAGRVLAAIPKPNTRGGSCLVLLRRRRSE
jgi:DNA-nicking Smr family endonuclease